MAQRLSSCLSQLCMRLVIMMAVSLSSVAIAMEELEDSSMGEVTGEGLAIALKDIYIAASPTSYVEAIGTNPSTTAYKRADLRWYGLTISGATPVGAWAGSCGAGIMSMGCPLGDIIGDMAPHDNPLLIRAFNIKGIDFAGTSNVSKTELELLWPTAHEGYRFAFWGELKVGGDANNRIQISNIYNNIRQDGSKLRIFQHGDPADRTFGMMWENHFSADIRMSAAQTFLSPDSYEMVPEFDDQEGMYIEDYRVYFPLGQPHYMSVIFDNVASGDGNFAIKLTPLPNVANIYNDFYGRTNTNDPTNGYDRTKWQASYYRTHGYLRIGDQGYSGSAYVCHADKTGCSSTANGQYEIGDKGSANASSGMFFVSAPGNTFPVARYPNPWGTVSNSAFPAYGGCTNCDLGGWANADPQPGGTAICNSSGVTCNNQNTVFDQRSSINLGDSRLEGILVQQLTLKTLGI